MADLSFSEGLATLQRRAKWARYALWTYIVSNLIGVAFIGAMGTGLFGGLLSSEEAGGVPSTGTVVLGLVLVAYAVIVLFNALTLIIVVPMWTFRAWKNLIALRIDGLNYSAGWATGSFFVPIINLFVPFQAMRELHNRSHGEEAYWARSSVGDVTSWWACWIGGTFVTAFVQLAQLFNQNGVIMIVAHPIVWGLTALFGAALQLGAAWFLIRVIREITAAQGSTAGISETFA